MSDFDDLPTLRCATCERSVRPEDATRTRTCGDLDPELRETVERQRRDISYLAAAADIDSVEPVCPDCGEGVLERSSGLTWTQVSCPECGLKRYL